MHAVTRTFHEIHGDYDILLLDCQPLFVSADTEYLARTSDATLLIVESGMVLKQDLLRAARLLERLPVPSVAVMLNQLKLARAGADLREDLREFVTFGRGFAHGKPIPLTTTRHADYPVSTPGSYQAHEELRRPFVPPATVPPPAPFVSPINVPSSDYMPPPARESHTYEPPPEHESGEHLEDDRSDSRNDSEDET